MATSVTRRTRDYEITVDGTHAGLVAFEEQGANIVFTHTEIDEAFGGQGIGGQLAKAALDDVRSRGLSVVPMCPFIAGWINKHPDYADLVQGAHSSDG
jgi:predicted GNAT family acetyltransferase